MTTSIVLPGTKLIRCPGKAIGRIEETATGFEIVFGNGRRAVVVAPAGLEAELRANLGKTVSLNGIKMFDPRELRTVEVVANSTNPRPGYDPVKFRERMDRLAELLGPVFANVDPRKFGREDDE